MGSEQAVKMQFSNLPTVFTDGVNIACRTDDAVLLMFYSETPDRLIENFRTIMLKEEAVAFLNNLAAAIDHFPVKETQKEVEPPRPRAKRALRKS